MSFLLYTIHVLVSLFLILVVLLQQGKGADLSVFGGGSTMTAFGARGAASLLHKLTVGGFVVFIVTTLAIGVSQTGSSDDVLRGLDETAAATSVDTETGSEEEEPAVTGVFPEEDTPTVESDSPAGDESGAGGAAQGDPPAESAEEPNSTN